MSYLSKNIRFLRKKNKWGQDKLAELVDRSQPTIQQWESGLRSPNMATVDKLSKLFNVSMNTLVYTDIEETNNNSSDKSCGNTFHFNTAEEALQYIISQPMVAASGGYNLGEMTDEQIIEFANDLMDLLKIAAKKYK